MKILLVHPDDSLEVGPWAETRWDSVVDLGWSGRHIYAEQSQRLGFRVLSVYDLIDHQQHRSRMRELLALGLDFLVDSESVDWWDTFSPLLYEKLEHILLSAALLDHVPDDAELFATRPHFVMPALSLLSGSHGRNRELRSFLKERKPQAIGARWRRYAKAAVTLRPAQISEIAFDKWDSDYRIRRKFALSPRPYSQEVILLPSAYGNVSRSQVAYARMLPHRRFLLVVTRRSGTLSDLPSNVELRSLAAYAPPAGRSARQEELFLLERWRELQNNLLQKNRIFRVSKQLRVLDGFTKFLKHMLRVRDAWREVLMREPVGAVLSADESNPTTRLPILLAQSRKVHTVFCDHGALNMSFGIRRPASNTYLVRGEMARDYTVNWCGLPAGQIVVGGPRETLNRKPPSKDREKDWIVFYSEDYELSYGRTRSLYAEIMPELCWLAKKTNRKVVVKLHPFESRRMRNSILNTILTPEQKTHIEIQDGPMTPKLFERAWCSLTVESSVAVESTTNGVPCFLCSWFDASWYDYGKQYAKYSAGHQLNGPQEIRDIPHLITKIHITEETRQRLQTTITPEKLDSVLSGR